MSYGAGASGCTENDDTFKENDIIDFFPNKDEVTKAKLALR